MSFTVWGGNAGHVAIANDVLLKLRYILLISHHKPVIENQSGPLLCAPLLAVFTVTLPHVAWLNEWSGQLVCMMRFLICCWPEHDLSSDWESERERMTPASKVTQLSVLFVRPENIHVFHEHVFVLLLLLMLISVFLRASHLVFFNPAPSPNWCNIRPRHSFFFWWKSLSHCFPKLSWPFAWEACSLLVFESGYNLPPTRCRWSQRDPALGPNVFSGLSCSSCCVLMCLFERAHRIYLTLIKMLPKPYSTRCLCEMNKSVCRHWEAVGLNDS